MLGKHIIDTRCLMEITRYPNIFRHKQRSVASHSWSVAQIALGLAMLETKKFNNEVNVAELLSRAISHDILEAKTGDIIWPLKYGSSLMQSAINDLEEKIYNIEIEPEIPMSWREDYRRFILEAKSEDIEGRILSAADIIDTILESIEEIKLSNTEFEKVFFMSIDRLMKIDLKSVGYFIKYSLNDFGLTEKYLNDKIVSYQNNLDFAEYI